MKVRGLFPGGWCIVISPIDLECGDEISHEFYPDALLTRNVVVLEIFQGREATSHQKLNPRSEGLVIRVICKCFGGAVQYNEALSESSAIAGHERLLPMKTRVVILASLVCFAPLPAFSFFDNFMEGLGKFGIKSPDSVSEDKVIEGLKEALKVGTEKAVNLTGVANGFLTNDAIKIVMPEQLQKVDQALRLVGFGPQLDELVVSMNRGAEQATALAKPIFVDAIQNMSFEDAKGILQGGDTAATEYFQKTTTDKLSVTFHPQVEAALNQVGVTKQYRELVGKYESLPFVDSLAFDLDQYVVDNSLKGLFHVVAEEERKIRMDPTARVTDLLKEVFGSQK